MHDTNSTNGVNEISPNESKNVEPRGNPAVEKPYCWQSKHALRAIRAAYGNDTRLLPYLMSTYLALSEIASDEGRPVFTKSISEILVKAGGSYRKLVDVLALLARLGLLHIRHNYFDRGKERGKAPSTYTLLTDARHAQPLCTEQRRSVPIEEKNANAKNKKESHHLRDAGFGVDEKESAGWRQHYSEDELAVIDQYHATCGDRGWLRINANSQELHDALDTFQDRDLDDFKQMFEEAANYRDAGEAGYNCPRGNKLIRILWANY